MSSPKFNSQLKSGYIRIFPCVLATMNKKQKPNGCSSLLASTKMQKQMQLQYQQNASGGIVIPSLITDKDIKEMNNTDKVINQMICKQKKQNLYLRQNHADITDIQYQHICSERLAIPNKEVVNPRNLERINELNTMIKKFSKAKTVEDFEEEQVKDNYQANNNDILNNQKREQLNTKITITDNIRRKKLQQQTNKHQIVQPQNIVQDQQIQSKRVEDMSFQFQQLLHKQQELYNQLFDKLKLQLNEKSYVEGKQEIIEKYSQFEKDQINMVKNNMDEQKCNYQQQMGILNEEQEQVFQQQEYNYFQPDNNNKTDFKDYINNNIQKLNKDQEQYWKNIEKNIKYNNQLQQKQTQIKEEQQIYKMSISSLKQQNFSLNNKLNYLKQIFRTNIDNDGNDMKEDLYMDLINEEDLAIDQYENELREKKEKQQNFKMQQQRFKNLIQHINKDAISQQSESNLNSVNSSTEFQEKSSDHRPQMSFNMSYNFDQAQSSRQSFSFANSKKHDTTLSKKTFQFHSSINNDLSINNHESYENYNTQYLNCSEYTNTATQFLKQQQEEEQISKKRQQQVALSEYGAPELREEYLKSNAFTKQQKWVQQASICKSMRLLQNSSPGPDNLSEQQILKLVKQDELNKVQQMQAKVIYYQENLVLFLNYVKEHVQKELSSKLLVVIDKNAKYIQDLKYQISFIDIVKESLEIEKNLITKKDLNQLEQLQQLHFRFVQAKQQEEDEEDDINQFLNQGFKVQKQLNSLNNNTFDLQLLSPRQNTSKADTNKQQSLLSSRGNMSNALSSKGKFK